MMLWRNENLLNHQESQNIMNMIVGEDLILESFQLCLLVVF